MVRVTDDLSLGSPCAKLFRSEILQRHNIRFDTGQRLFEDACFVFQYLAHCDSVYISDKSIYFYDTIGSVSSGFYDDVFFRDFSKYVRGQMTLIETLAKKTENNLSLCSCSDVIAQVSERNSFMHIMNIYKLYRSDTSDKYAWLKRCLAFANSMNPDWYTNMRIGLPKYIAFLHRWPFMLHCMLKIVFVTEAIIRRK